ncbi:hypothetical protein KEM56_005939, partial [Ascosphaera pollenicola]
MARFGSYRDTTEKSSWHVHGRESAQQVCPRVGLKSTKLSQLGASDLFLNKLKRAHTSYYGEPRMPNGYATEPVIFYASVTISSG